MSQVPQSQESPAERSHRNPRRSLVANEAIKVILRKRSSPDAEVALTERTWDELCTQIYHTLGVEQQEIGKIQVGSNIIKTDTGVQQLKSGDKVVISTKQDVTMARTARPSVPSFPSSVNTVVAEQVVGSALIFGTSAFGRVNVAPIPLPPSDYQRIPDFTSPDRETKIVVCQIEPSIFNEKKDFSPAESLHVATSGQPVVVLQLDTPELGASEWHKHNKGQAFQVEHGFEVEHGFGCHEDDIAFYMVPYGSSSETSPLQFLVYCVSQMKAEQCHTAITKQRLCVAFDMDLTLIEAINREQLRKKMKDTEANIQRLKASCAARGALIAPEDRKNSLAKLEKSFDATSMSIAGGKFLLYNRPGLDQLKDNLNREDFLCIIATAGGQKYAEDIMALVDPGYKIFKRIVSFHIWDDRGQSTGKAHPKDLNLVTSLPWEMVAVVDDLSHMSTAGHDVARTTWVECQRQNVVPIAAYDALSRGQSTEELVRLWKLLDNVKKIYYRELKEMCKVLRKGEWFALPSLQGTSNPDHPIRLKLPVIKDCINEALGADWARQISPRWCPSPPQANTTITTATHPHQPQVTIPVQQKAPFRIVMDTNAIYDIAKWTEESQDFEMTNVQKADGILMIPNDVWVEIDKHDHLKEKEVPPGADDNQKAKIAETNSESVELKDYARKAKRLIEKTLLDRPGLLEIQKEEEANHLREVEKQSGRLSGKTSNQKTDHMVLVYAQEILKTRPRYVGVVTTDRGMQVDAGRRKVPVMPARHMHNPQKWGFFDLLSNNPQKHIGHDKGHTYYHRKPFACRQIFKDKCGWWFP